MLVSGFVDLGRYESAPRARASADYVSRANTWLLSSPLPHVVFMDYTAHPANCWSLRDERRAQEAIRSSSAHQRIQWNTAKDTAAYFCVMRHKIEWLVTAAESATAPWYTWIDFGYRNLTDDRLEDLLDLPPLPDTIRIAELSYVPKVARMSRELFYQQHWWPVGGGVIAARDKELNWLRDRIAEEWEWALANGYAVTDEMMIGFIRYQHPERFDIYYADHPTLVTNYMSPRGSHDLIRYMALRARADGDEQEAQRRIAAITESRPRARLQGAVGASEPSDPPGHSST